MKTMTAIFFLLCMAPAIGVAAARPTDGARAEAAARFALVRPGLPLEDAFRCLGKPTADYPAWVIRDEVDPFVDFPSAQSLRELALRARQTGREVVKVRLLEWREGADVAKLVFVDGKVWYAVLPAPPSRSIEGAQPVPLTETKGDVKLAWTMYVWPEKGEAFLIASHGTATRLVFPPHATIFSPR